jgi:hypothetical protein
MNISIMREQSGDYSIFIKSLVSAMGGEQLNTYKIHEGADVPSFCASQKFGGVQSHEIGANLQICAIGAKVKFAPSARHTKSLDDFTTRVASPPTDYHSSFHKAVFTKT